MNETGSRQVRRPNYMTQLHTLLSNDVVHHTVDSGCCCGAAADVAVTDDGRWSRMYAQFKTFGRAAEEVSACYY